MLSLNDSKLEFASDLLGHWQALRSDALVPAKEDIDPARMLRSLPYIAIVDLTNPQAVQTRLVGTGLRRRFGREITRTNWLEVIPQERRSIAALAARALVEHPCGAYYRFTVAYGDDNLVEAETLVLPLRSLAEPGAAYAIALSRDIALYGDDGDRSSATARLVDLERDFVDVGAGVPGQKAVKVAGGTVAS